MHQCKLLMAYVLGRIALKWYELLIFHFQIDISFICVSFSNCFVEAKIKGTKLGFHFSR